MGYKLSFDEVSEFFNKIRGEYKIFAPKRFKNQGRYSNTDIIKYAEVTKADEIVFDEKSTYPAKEVVTPISQTLYYFTDDEIRESTNKDNRKILIFGRPCDINAQERQDKIYLQNGNFQDEFYKRVRDRVKFICMECTEGFDTCFCVAMNSNKTDNYSMAVRLCDDGILFNVKEEEFDKYFAECRKSEFELEFIKKNKADVRIPEIKDKDTLAKLKKHPMWNEFNGRCIECGSCTVACSTCSCYTTKDIIYDAEGNIGERRRIQASCHIDGFDEMAGGHKFRSTAGDKMRYKVLHKIHDYKEKFGDNHMCVGCGRCTDRCPQYISMTATINKAANAVDEIMKER